MSLSQASVSIGKISVERKTCRLCGKHEMTDILNLGDQYLAGFLDEPDVYAPRAPLHLVQCQFCGLLQLKHTTDPDMMFREYWYRSGVNQTMRDELRDVVNSTLPFVEDGAWLDIGANDGTLLDYVPKEFVKVACEPAATFSDQLKEHADVVIPDYFTHKAIKDHGERKFDAITSCAMFYDLDEPGEFVQDIASVLAPAGVWVNQLNDSPTMLQRNAFDGICHEHLTYWSVPQLKELYKKHGLKIVKVSANDINGGSVRVFAVHKDRPIQEYGKSLPSPEVNDSLQFAARVQRWRSRLSSILCDEANRRGPLWGYGASTKAVCLLQYLNQSNVFKAIADRNPAKWGKVMTGSWLAVASEADLRMAMPGMAVVFIWAFRPEILNREKDLIASGTPFLFPLPNIEIVL